MTAPQSVLVTVASSGFGALIVRALAGAGHTVHAGMRDVGPAEASPPSSWPASTT